MLKLNNLHIKVHDRTLFKSHEISLNKGLFALVGINGAGKSTFFNCIQGNYTNWTGSININDSEITPGNAINPQKVAIVLTKTQLFGNHTVEEVLKLGRLPYQNNWGGGDANGNSIFENVIEALKLSNFLSRYFEELSDGEKQKVMIGRALIQDTPLLLLDEPLAFLDLINQKEILTILKRIAENKLILFSTHHIYQIDKFCDGALFINNGFMEVLDHSKSYLSQISQALELDEK